MDDLLERQWQRQRAPILASGSSASPSVGKHSRQAAGAAAGSGKKTAPVAAVADRADDEGYFDDHAVANPTSAASIIVDESIARKVARARASLDLRRNVEAHIENHRRSQMPRQYMKEVRRTIAVGQRIYNKGSRKAIARSGHKQLKPRLPADEHKAEVERRSKRNNRTHATRGNPAAAAAGKKKKKLAGNKKKTVNRTLGGSGGKKKKR